MRERRYLEPPLPLQSPAEGSPHNSAELWWSFDGGQDFQQNKSPVAWGTSGFFQMLAALQTDQKKKKIHFSHLKMYFQVSLVGLNELLQYLSSFAICFPFVRIHTAKLGRGGRWEINSTLYINTSISCKILLQPFLHTTPCTKDKKIQKECNERKPVS